MINIAKVRETVTDLLQSYISCVVVQANQTAHVPKHPYVSFTITTPMAANNGTYGRYDDDVNRKPIKQIWSLTSHSDNSDEAFTLACRAHNFLDAIGNTKFKENGITVEMLGNVTNRDTLLTTFYEYRCGFDVTFTMMDEIDQSEFDEGEIISADIKNK